jgi:hypothetical protein
MKLKCLIKTLKQNNGCKGGIITLIQGDLLQLVLPRRMNLCLVKIKQIWTRWWRLWSDQTESVVPTWAASSSSSRGTSDTPTSYHTFLHHTMSRGKNIGKDGKGRIDFNSSRVSNPITSETRGEKVILPVNSIMEDLLKLVEGVLVLFIYELWNCPGNQTTKY